ncbi:uncharacterized protein LOC121267173 [Juglans microcarpa x Juglans regia]|uniref:uncharacterized protein LOC121267173 n=1 Tax=Juglans microcarpa x Juglans regia TaxID=2249226 RepID=UPI001B7EEDEF|nr:uncharacterized protein LOC121267173 [Juglans microcarpa x Juglans regia]
MDNGQASSSSQHNQLWSKQWKLKVPPADKIFLWRACNEALPTNFNLHKKKIIEKPCCPIYLQEEEIVILALWTCPAAQDVWHQYSRQIKKSPSSFNSLRDLFLELDSVWGQELVEELAVVSERIWLRRNAYDFQKEFKDPNSVAEHGKCKIGLGLIIRDWNGLVLATSRQIRSLYPNPFLAESVGAMEAACFGSHLGLKRIILEEDSLLVIQAINSKVENWSTASMIINDIKSQLTIYDSWSVLHIRREGNKAAHVLAKNALLSSTSFVDVGSISSCILDYI